MFREAGLGIAGSLVLIAMSAAGQSLDWVTQIGTSAREGYEMALDADGAGGYVVVSGTEGELVAGAQQGGRDAWVAGFDGGGVQQWIYQFGTPAGDDAEAVMGDGAGGAIVGGYTFGSLYAPHAGWSDAFFARYSATGGLVWGRQLGGAWVDHVNDFAPDGAGGFYVAGDTSGSLGGPLAGDRDLFLARYDGDGNQLWIRQQGTSAGDTLPVAAPDAQGGVFFCGMTLGSLAGPSRGGQDVVLMRYDADGELQWSLQIGSAVFDWVTCAEPDGAGGFYVGGYTAGSLGGPVVGLNDAWLARYDAAGNRLWIRQFGTSDYDFGQALAQDGAGGVYFVGSAGRELFGAHIGDWDAWVARYTPSGDRIGEVQFGTTMREYTSGAVADGKGGLVCGGATEGDFGGPSFGSADIWLAHLTDNCYADCDASGGLDFFDFLCFQNLFALSDPGADCDGGGMLDLFDFLCFQNEFAAGCP